MTELAEMVFEMPVKLGVPQEIGGLRDVVNSPKYATGVGLLKFGARNALKSRFPIREKNIYDKVSWINAFLVERFILGRKLGKICSKLIKMIIWVQTLRFLVLEEADVMP